jgi:hypothetical protein
MQEHESPFQIFVEFLMNLINFVSNISIYKLLIVVFIIEMSSFYLI